MDTNKGINVFWFCNCFL